MHEATHVSTSSSPQTIISKDSSNNFEDPTLFRQVEGTLQYLALTRPDITMAINKATQFMHSPSINHWQAVKRILRYLKGTIDHGLILKPSSSPTLFAFFDADWGGDKIDRKST